MYEDDNLALLERDDFTATQGRVAGLLAQCPYPLMQGWDSVEIHADELGGASSFSA